MTRSISCLGHFYPKVVLITFVLFYYFTTVVFCENYYYKEPVNGLWSDLNSWVIGSQDSGKTPQSLPTTGDTVFITLDGNYEVEYDVGSDQTPVYEKLVIGSGTESGPVANIAQQVLVLKTPLSVNSLIEIQSSGSLIIDENLVTLKGGAKIVCHHGGTIIQKSGAIEVIGDIEVSGIFVLEGGIISGAAERNLIVNTEGTFRTFGPGTDSKVQRNSKISGVFDHSSTGLVDFTKELLIDNDGTLAINTIGPILASNAVVKGSMTVNAEAHLQGTFDIYGKAKLLKPLYVHDNLNLKRDGSLYLDYASFTCMRNCKFEGLIEGSSQTQSNFIIISKLCTLELLPESNVRGNLEVTIEEGGILSTRSDDVDFTGKVDGKGELHIVSGNFKTNSIIIYGLLKTHNIPDFEAAREIGVGGEVKIFGKFWHSHTSAINFRSAITIDDNSTMIWDGSGDIVGDGFLHNRGSVIISASANLGIDKTRNEGLFDISASKFTISSQNFLQENTLSQLHLNGTRLVFEANSILNNGQITVVEPNESYLVIGKEGTFDSYIPITGRVSISIYGKMNLYADISVSRNIDVFPEAILNGVKGNIDGAGQMIVHQDGVFQIDATAMFTIEKMLLVAGELQVYGGLVLNNDVTTLEGSGKLRLTENGKVSGDGHFSNHGEFIIGTTVPSNVEIVVNNAGILRIRSDCKFMKGLQQVDAKAETILENVVVTTMDDFTIADGTLIGIGTINSKSVSVAGAYGAFIDDKIGTLRVEGKFHSSASATAKFKIKSLDEYSVIETKDNIEIDGSVIEIDIVGNVDLKGRSIPLYKGRRIIGQFGDIHVSGTNSETELKYYREDGRVVFQMKGEPDSSSNSLSFNIVIFAMLIISSVLYLVGGSF